MADRLTYTLAVRCGLCGQLVPDQHRAPFCRGHRRPTTRIVAATENGREVLTLTHARIVHGVRHWGGTGEDGRTVIWEDS